jgi:hypothetical protein
MYRFIDRGNTPEAMSMSPNPSIQSGRAASRRASQSACVRPAADFERYVSENIGAIYMRTIFTLLTSLLLTSCGTISTLPSSFTTANVMKVHQGMSSDEILQLFGQPKNIRSAICGREPNQWACTT